MTDMITVKGEVTEDGRLSTCGIISPWLASTHNDLTASHAS
ncbi:MAG TPA: hypothetical protein VKY59_12615 [Spirillospora sp.]|nr:hypothetical protein [Spirillospora sp.]